jgi:hypothetical protein
MCPAESEVRASVAFQVSRLASLLVRALRSAASRDAWDGLVTGGWVEAPAQSSGFGIGVLNAPCRDTACGTLSERLEPVLTS